MIFRRLSEKEIAEIYHNRMPYDFAPGEIKPLSRIMELWKLKRYICYGMFLEDEGKEVPAGYCFLVISNRKDAVLLDYFAVSDKERGKGYGTTCFSLLKKEIQKQGLGTLILEVENPRFGADVQDISIRRRRIGFYRRNGMSLTHLRIFLYDVEYLVMTAESREIFQSAEQIYHVYEVLLKPDKIKTKLKITSNIRCIVINADEEMLGEKVRDNLLKLEKLGVYVIYKQKLNQELTNKEPLLQKAAVNPEECIVFGDSIPLLSAKNTADCAINVRNIEKTEEILEEILQIMPNARP